MLAMKFHRLTVPQKIVQFEELGEFLLATGILSREEAHALAKMIAGEIAIETAGGTPEERLGAAREAQAAVDPDARPKLLESMADVVANVLLSGHPATMGTLELGAWIYLVGSNADRIQILFKGNQGQRLIALHVRNMFRMLESHPAFENAHAGLHLLHARCAELLELKPNTRFLDRGEGWWAKGGGR